MFSLDLALYLVIQETARLVKREMALLEFEKMYVEYGGES